MWRQFTRGLQYNFKKSLCFEKTEPYVKEGNTNAHNDCCIIKLLPCAFQKLYIIPKQEDKYKQNGKKSSKNISQHPILEAFGWSGALVFGWVISQQLWIKQKWVLDRQDKKNIVSNNRPISLIQLFSSFAKTQPPATYILPQLPSKPIINSSKDTVNSEATSLEDEFEAAARKLKEIHDKTIGEALNRRGIACLSTSQTEAISYFKRASKFNYPPASFNMGQCCELGIGTDQDFKQAAEWYTIASEQGHATAMYNLGVFYAHGWGGLNSDINTAKNLFIKAAALGQPDAKAALDKESKAPSGMNLKTKSNGVQFINSGGIPKVPLKLPELNYFVTNYKNELTDDGFQRRLISEKNWDVPFNTTVAF